MFFVADGSDFFLSNKANAMHLVLVNIFTAVMSCILETISSISGLTHFLSSWINVNQGKISSHRNHVLSINYSDTRAILL